MSDHPTLEALRAHREKFRSELYDSVLPFWMRHSLDRENGGYFNCLDRDGGVWDTTKHVWLQGRQVWMLSKIYNADPSRAEYLDAARLGAEFLSKYARTADDRVYFSLTAEGKPVFMQRKIFSECFYAMAMAEFARASGEEKYRDEARSLFAKILLYAKDATLVGRPVYEGTIPESVMAVPMILLNLIDEISDPGETTYAETADWCVARMKRHIRPELGMVLEHIGADGDVLDTPMGRMLNPGHAIEAGWFLLDYAMKNGRDDLVELALNAVDWSFEQGWDDEFGGLYYFLDRKGYSPPQLEWNMKLWWPHCEALVAFAMAYEATKRPEYFEKFEKVADYSFAHFSDPEHGEWFGYLDRRGERTHRFKGGAYKGCFHVPRALFVVEKVLGRLCGDQ